jgi:hypothetical protein
MQDARIPPSASARAPGLRARLAPGMGTACRGRGAGVLPSLAKGRQLAQEAPQLHDHSPRRRSRRRRADLPRPPASTAAACRQSRCPRGLVGTRIPPSAAAREPSLFADRAEIRATQASCAPASSRQALWMASPVRGCGGHGWPIQSYTDVFMRPRRGLAIRGACQPEPHRARSLRPITHTAENAWWFRDGTMEARAARECATPGRRGSNRRSGRYVGADREG